jgi:hypothetical protein
MQNNLSTRVSVVKERLYLEDLRRKAFHLPAIIFLVTTLGLMYCHHLYMHTDLWSHMPVASGNAFHFCEANHMDEAIRQPSNTWSNLGYLAVGLFALTLAVHDYKNKKRDESENFLVRYPLFSVMYALSCFYLFIGSFMYHASLTAFFQKLDQTGLYSVIAMILVLNLYKIFPYFNHRGSTRNSHKWAKVLVIVLNIAFFNWLWRININALVPGLLLMIIITGMYYTLAINRTAYFTKYMYAAFLIMFAAGSVWILDRQRVVCQPDSFLQGHALWHILTAVSIFFIYLYYRSGSLDMVNEELETAE